MFYLHTPCLSVLFTVASIVLSPHPAFSVLSFTFVLFFFLSRIYILNTCVHWTSLSEAKYLWSSKQSEGLRSAGCAQVGRSSGCAQVSRVAGCAQVSVVCPGQHKLWAGQVLGVKADCCVCKTICMWICRVCIGVKSRGFSALFKWCQTSDTACESLRWKLVFLGRELPYICWRGWSCGDASSKKDCPALLGESIYLVMTFLQREWTCKSANGNKLMWELTQRE